MADMIFNKFPYLLAKGEIDLDSHTFKIALVTDVYTPNAADETWNNASIPPGTCEVASGNGYTTGGKTLTNAAVSVSGGTTKFTDTVAADMQWTNATLTARYAIIYDDSTSPKYLVCLFDFGANKSVSAGTFQLNANANGFFTIAQAA